MLRRQRHANALAYVGRKIVEKTKMLDDVQVMMAEVEGDDLLKGWHAQKAMWQMLDDVVWMLVEDIEAKERRIGHVLKLNKDRDEDEAWKIWWNITDEEFDHLQGRRGKTFCGLPIIGQRS